MAADIARQIQSLLELLETVRKHPAMYMGRARPGEAVAFLMGVAASTQTALGVSTQGEPRWQVWKDRGWDQGGARGPVAHMQQDGLTDDKIVDELIAMEIEVWKRAAANALG